MFVLFAKQSQGLFPIFEAGVWLCVLVEETDLDAGDCVRNTKATPHIFSRNVHQFIDYPDRLEGASAVRQRPSLRHLRDQDARLREAGTRPFGEPDLRPPPVVGLAAAAGGIATLEPPSQGAAFLMPYNVDFNNHMVA